VTKKKHEPTPRTYFDQVPLDVVKKIAKVDASSDVSKNEKAGTKDTKRNPKKESQSGAPARSRNRKRP
jgi:hypothetical protein